MSAQPLARAFRQIGGMTAVSRILGFFRDVVFAMLLGAGPCDKMLSMFERACPRLCISALPRAYVVRRPPPLLETQAEFSQRPTPSRWWRCCARWV